MSKYIWRSSMIIPLFVIYLVLTRSVTISIPEIDIYWGCNYTTFFCIIVTFIWLCCSPLKKSCCNGGLIEMLFNLVPISIILMFVFAQWHFTLTIILAISFIILEILLHHSINNEEKKHHFSAKRHRQYKNIFKRCSVIIILIVTLIPCWLSIFVYDLRSPIYKAEEDLWAMLTSDEYVEEKIDTENIYTQNAELFACFADDRWKDFNVTERITIMQKLVDFESESLGIPTMPVSTGKLSEYTLGQYDNGTHEIVIDIQNLMKSPIERSVATICHEVFHSAQNFLVANIDWNNEVFQSAAYFEELRSWKSNGEHYIDALEGGYDAYESQPLEASAREYAEKETQMILSYI